MVDNKFDGGEKEGIEIELCDFSVELEFCFNELNDVDEELKLVID